MVDQEPGRMPEFCVELIEGRYTVCPSEREEQKEGWRIRQVSGRYRNPADGRDEYETRVLAEFAASKARGEFYADTEHVEVVAEEGRTHLRYLKPITVGSPICLSCLGGPQDISPEVRSELQRLYPDDRAVGYRMADLRGAVSAKIPLDRGREERDVAPAMVMLGASGKGEAKGTALPPRLWPVRSPVREGE